MAIYTGFFDAAFDEATGTYDREYGSADFTGYFGQIVGSGVCVHGNDDSMRVYYDAASKRAVVNPGYLFIRGYWLKNDGLYTVDLADLPAGVYAIRAALNLGTRSITIGQVPKATPEEYPDALVLAYATVAEGGVTVEDTRGRTDICGMIDAAGSLSVKVDYAIHYIDNDINGKLDQIQQNLQAQEAEIDGKIAEANGLIAKIAPPAVGTIKFSASQDIEEGWLRCDGSFISEADYPELVAALGKNYPSGDKFQLLNTTGVGRQISNGVVCLGRLWVFSYADRKLYGIDVEGDEAPKVIELTSEDLNFSGWQNPNSNFLALSIIPDLTTGSGYHLFLAQINNPSNHQWDAAKNLIYSSAFTGSESTIKMSVPFDASSLTITSYLQSAIPFVISKLEGGKEKFYCLVQTTLEGETKTTSGLFMATSLSWFNGEQAEKEKIDLGKYSNNTYGSYNYYYMLGYSEHNLNELVYIYTQHSKSSTDTSYRQSIVSLREGTFDRDGVSSEPGFSFPSPTTLVIAGDDIVLCQVSSDLTQVISIERTTISASKKVSIRLSLPSSARPFTDGCTYLWGKKMFMIFVGTGIIFSRDLSEGSFGYLDTTSVLGTITQYASIRYSQDEGTLYIVGQDTTNTIRAAKIVLNTLYDYASDGAWLPLIASDGIPAYIKAIGEPPPPPPPAPVVFNNLYSLSHQDAGLPALASIFNVTLNGETLLGGKKKEYPVESILKMTALQDYTNPQSTELDFGIIAAGKQDNSWMSGTHCLGRVLARGEQIKKGETVQVTINMNDIKDKYSSLSTDACFWFVTKSAQGSP